MTEFSLHLLGESQGTGAQALRSPAEKDVRFALLHQSVLYVLDGGLIHTRPTSVGPTWGSVDGDPSKRILLIHLLLWES